MSKSAVLKIKETEAEAQKIIDDAKTQARKAVNDCEATCKNEIEQFETNLRADYKTRLDGVKNDVDVIVSKNAADDERRYKLYEAAAEQRMPDAVKIIMQGVVSECQ